MACPLNRELDDHSICDGIRNSPRKCTGLLLSGLLGCQVLQPGYNLTDVTAMGVALLTSRGAADLAAFAAAASAALALAEAFAVASASSRS